MWWLTKRCGGSIEDVVAQKKTLRLNRKCEGSKEDVVTQ
jgi:hypothetical protein